MKINSQTKHDRFYSGSCFISSFFWHYSAVRSRDVCVLPIFYDNNISFQTHGAEFPWRSFLRVSYQAGWQGAPSLLAITLSLAASLARPTPAFT